MAAIPERCPICNERDQWEEVVNPFTTGIPIGANLRIGFGSGFHKVKYRCGKCGFEDKYDLYECPNRLPDRHL